MKAIIDILLELLSALFEGVESLFEKDDGSNAIFGNPSKLINKRNKGWVIDGKRALDMETSRRNFCVVAGSGMKKTQTHVFTTILNSDSSMLVTDNSSELAVCASYLESKGTISLILNLTKKSGVYLNPLDGCKGDISAIRKISKALMGNASKENDFFSLSGEDCLTTFIQYVLESEPTIYANLGNVYRLILEYQGSPKTIERLMAEKASESVWMRFKALTGNSERTLKSITATSLSALSWLGDNAVLSDITSVSNISFEAFRKKSHCLFIQSPASDSAFYAPMISLIFNSFYRFAFSRLPSENDLDIMMILDEFSGLIKGLPDYSQIISNSRKYRIPQCIILQEESLLSPYKELKDNILGNCFVKVYYGGQEKKSFELEKLLGMQIKKDSKTGKESKTPLMTASQIREMNEEILVIPNGQKPLKVSITPAYKQSSLRKKMEMKQDDEAQEQLPEYTIQYIDLAPFRKEKTAPSD
jgi:type IV secretory pathway TraG/TraD family ATPase VirD4